MSDEPKPSTDLSYLSISCCYATTIGCFVLSATQSFWWGAAAAGATFLFRDTMAVIFGLRGGK